MGEHFLQAEGKGYAEVASHEMIWVPVQAFSWVLMRTGDRKKVASRRRPGPKAWKARLRHVNLILRVQESFQRILSWKVFSSSLRFFLAESTVAALEGCTGLCSFSLSIGFFPMTFKPVLESPVLKNSILTPDLLPVLHRYQNRLNKLHPSSLQTIPSGLCQNSSKATSDLCVTNSMLSLQTSSYYNSQQQSTHLKTPFPPS